MLELKGIKKDYLAGENTVHALKGIDLQFRKSEFVSILGQSGCGKTTMLNIIGGLDQYTEGDLIINGTSTKDFKNRDWDTYRNHSIGFVFQSYNLIPHQTVLQNVEIALTLSGVSKTERRERAKQALKEVGLESQLNKKPSEMSGGQMQRVAIARALVNNPDIILADEPTGALDTETSIQVMEILKEISKDRLIIMVTHNPELAEKYSSRIIRMLDGKITDDSAPLSAKECQIEDAQNKADREKKKKTKKPSMKLSTSFMLSLKNLFTKKGRTLLTSFAGSIGIIGIALIFAISQGFQNYIDLVQENTLSSYPLTIEKQTVDLTTLMETFMASAKSDSEHDTDAIYKKSATYDIINSFVNIETKENDLRSFKAFVEDKYADKSEENRFDDAINGIQYAYNLDLLVYTKNVDGTIIYSDTQSLLVDMMSEFFGADMSSMMTMSDTMMEGFGTMAQMNNGAMLWQELLPGDNGAPVNDLLKSQYDVIYGSWPNSYDEVVLVVDENNELNDLVLYALGLESEENMNKIMDAAMNKTELDVDTKSWSYEEICDMEFRTVLNSSCYSYDETTGLYTDLRESETGIQYLYDNGVKLKVSGIIRPNEDAQTTMLMGSIGYTSDLTEYVIENSKNADAVNAQLENPNMDILTGLPFKDETGAITEEAKAEAFRNHIDGLDDAGKINMYVAMKSIPTEDVLSAGIADAMTGVTRADMEAVLIQAMSQQMNMSESELASYITEMSDDEVTQYYSSMLAEQFKMAYAQSVQQEMAMLSPEELLGGLNAEIGTFTDAQLAVFYDEIMVFSESTYEKNLELMGYIDLDEPATINLFASSFENKDIIEEEIAEYNKNVDEVSKIQYTDYVGIMMSSITTIIDTITYVLIAFVAISLIVSSIMIGVITLISVQERTKEIGILRAIGASKRDVSSMFNAETVIIGFTSGLVGVLITYLLCIPINIIVHSLTDITALNAVLPLPVALILIAISMLLTLIAGIIPSRSAAKKDPVVALRSE